ncbi:flagellar hook assembly protein FlgD [Erwinia sorbitola]|uniref:Basal-body rod modification protein FlgD n=1 Tax=Erwinia sorbitola TaxID=2681984 RepID=A0A6I6F3T6_9GAMM|nr:flagellar hook assembly protein FlgD [Erwinia sorbitola]MTD26957.1 flagellar hook assembly protein FlgD [Erwinia sorbitola]QGU88520.1 flagellar hook assembly protein FlgD [Erwinia sorbitola]
MSVSNVERNYQSDDLNVSRPPAANGDDLNNMFMKLLVAQIQNQDPLNPTDGTEYVGQLAQMTQVQSMQDMTGMMQNAATLVDNMQVLAVGNLVGQQVMVRANSIELDGQPIAGRLTLEHPSGNVTVHIKDAAGKETTLELGRQQQGLVDFTLDPQALGLQKGKYTLSVVTEEGENNVPIEIAGTVNSVRIGKDGSPLLTLPGLGEIPFFNISQFGGQFNKA